MGFFDRFSGKKPAARPASPNGTHSAPDPVAVAPAAPSPVHNVKARLGTARDRLEAKDLPGAMAIYEELLVGGAGDRADVLVAISGDLGSHGHVNEIIELVAPRYDADRHGAATGLNLLQAYLAVRNADAAQHVLDILFALHRPDLEERLHGFSNAIAEIIASGAPITAAASGAASADPNAPKIGLITLSKPIWFYGLESMTAQILPPKEGRLRRIAFAQLALPNYGEKGAARAVKQPDDELPRLSRALPLWLAETFYFSPSYTPFAAIGTITPPGGANQHVQFGSEWTPENLRQLVETTEGGLDYIVTGALRATAGDYELTLRAWEVKNYRERKTFAARWTPSTADVALNQLHSEVRAYMEWSPASAAFAYTMPAQPRVWLDTLVASAGLFLAEKGVLASSEPSVVEADLKAAGDRAAATEAAALAYVTLQSRARRQGIAGPASVTLARSALVLQAQKELA